MWSKRGIEGPRYLDHDIWYGSGHMLSCANNRRTSLVICSGGELFDFIGQFTTSLCECMYSIVLHLRKIHGHSIGIRSRTPSHSKNLMELDDR